MIALMITDEQLAIAWWNTGRAVDAWEAFKRLTARPDQEEANVLPVKDHENSSSARP
jgi:hypothetical protein